MKNKIFYLGIGMLFTHELDAVSNSEWLVLPLISLLPDKYGHIVFVLVHIPLFAILVALISSQNIAIRNKSQFGISVFLVIHGVLHAVFMMHERYEFNSMMSNVLIFSGAICGVVYLVLNRIKQSIR